jgi:hypothetical protein
MDSPVTSRNIRVNVLRDRHELMRDAVEPDRLIECQVEKFLDVSHEFAARIGGCQRHMFRGQTHPKYVAATICER